MFSEFFASIKSDALALDSTAKKINLTSLCTDLTVYIRMYIDIYTYLYIEICSIEMTNNAISW